MYTAKNHGNSDDFGSEIFPEEIIHFSKLIDEQGEGEKIKMLSALNCFQIIYNNQLNSAFPNVDVV
jgi:hypothetical protein